MTLIKRDTSFDLKVVLLHNEWDFVTGRQLLHTRISSQRFTRFDVTPPSMHKTEPVIVKGAGVNGSDLVSYPHEETSVQVDSGYCVYQIFFRSDGKVESKVFA